MSSGGAAIIVTPAPMMSSSTYVEPLPAVNARARKLPLSSSEAAAIMAQHQPVRGRVLGVVNPGPVRAASTPIATGQFVNPAVGGITSRTTVNSTFGSQPVPAITSGVGEPVGGASPAVIRAEAGQVLPVTAISGGPIATGTTAAATVLAASTAQTPTTTAMALTPTQASSRLAPPSTTALPASVTGASATAGGTTVGPADGTTSIRSTDVTVGTAAVTSGTVSANVAGPVRIANTNGKVVVTNDKSNQ